MARQNFGAGENDFVFVPVTISGSSVPSLAVRNITFWSAATGGTQYTDLLNPGAVTSVNTDANGFIPAFQGPATGELKMWADANAGAGPRRLIVTTDIAAGSVTSVAGKTGVVTLVAADAGADASGLAASTVATHVAASDPHGDHTYADSVFRPVIEYNDVTGLWPLRASSAASQARRFEWVGPVGAVNPTAAGYMAEGDILTLLPV